MAAMLCKHLPLAHPDVELLHEQWKERNAAVGAGENVLKGAGGRIQPTVGELLPALKVPAPAPAFPPMMSCLCNMGLKNCKCFLDKQGNLKAVTGMASNSSGVAILCAPACKIFLIALPLPLLNQALSPPSAAIALGTNCTVCGRAGINRAVAH